MIIGKGVLELFKRILYILLVLFVAAVVFQLTRTFIFTRFIGNTNEAESLEKPVSAEIPDGAKFLKYLVISDRDEVNSSATKSQTEKVLDYMKLGYDSIDIDEAAGINIYGYDCIIFSFESLALLGESLPEYIEYVNKGGTLIFAIRPVIDPAFRSISDLLAIEEYDGIADNARGIRLERPLIIGLEDLDADLGFIQNSSIKAVLDQKKPLLYLSTYDDIPLLWETGYGQGKFILFNGTMLNEKTNRGVLSNIISISQDTIIYPIANIKMVHIDDFPAPVPRGINEPIMEEFNRTIAQFYREVWWSDMIRLAKRYDLLYSSFIIENYGNNTEPPFKGSARANEENLLVYGKEILNLGGELGLHGYTTPRSCSRRPAPSWGRAVRSRPTAWTTSSASGATASGRASRRPLDAPPRPRRRGADRWPPPRGRRRPRRWPARWPISRSSARTSCPRRRRASSSSGGQPGSNSVQGGLHCWWKRGAATACVQSVCSKTSARSTTPSTAVMMRGPPGLPSTRLTVCPPSRSTTGVIDESGRLPPATALASPPTSPNWLATSRPSAKSSISLLSRKPCAAHQDAAAEARVERGRQRQRVAVGVEHRQVRRALALARRPRGTQPGVGALPDRHAAAATQLGASSALERDVDEVGVAEERSRAARSCAAAPRSTSAGCARPARRRRPPRPLALGRQGRQPAPRARRPAGSRPGPRAPAAARCRPSSAAAW